MEIALRLLLLLFAIVLIVLLLIQARGTTGGLFGPGESTFHSRRGVERILFRATIVIGVVFIGTALLNAIFG